MDIHITAAHYCYLAGIVLILATMIARKNIVVPAVLATLVTATVYTMNPISGLASIFNGSLVAAAELFNIFLVIAFITAMLGAMKSIGADNLMVKPFRRIMGGPTSSFIVLAIVTYVISLFFWPTPAVPLVGAVLIPVAIRSGLPPLVAGAVIAIAGQGMALSSDYIIKVAPGLSATSAGVDVDSVADKSLVMSLIVGFTAMTLTFIFNRRSFRKPSPELLRDWEAGASTITTGDDPEPHDGGGGDGPPDSRMKEKALSGFLSRSEPYADVDPEYADFNLLTQADAHPAHAETGFKSNKQSRIVALADIEPVEDDDTFSNTKKARFFAIAVPAAYMVFIGYMIVAKFTSLVPEIQGGEAAALVGGIAVIMTYFICVTDNPENGFFDSCAEHIVEGLVFAFRAMGIVIPIAGFFFLGNGDFAGKILSLGDGATAPTLLFDLVNAAQSSIPDNPFITGFSILFTGIIAGLDGSGFSGLPLTGSLAGSLGPAVGMDPSTLAAIGQMGNIWTGGGTLVAWSSLIAVAGVARVPVVELVRRLFLPVVAGLFLSTFIAILVL